MADIVLLQTLRDPRLSGSSSTRTTSKIEAALRIVRSVQQSRSLADNTFNQVGELPSGFSGSTSELSRVSVGTTSSRTEESGRLAEPSSLWRELTKSPKLAFVGCLTRQKPLSP